jgi:hypothetical protein
VADVVDDVRLRVFPLIVPVVALVVIPCTVAAAQLIVIEFPVNEPVFVKAELMPMLVPECVPEMFMVLFAKIFVELEPPAALMAVAAVVPARFVNVMLLFEIVSATSDGVPDVNWK